MTDFAIEIKYYVCIPWAVPLKEDKNALYYNINSNIAIRIRNQMIWLKGLLNSAWKSHSWITDLRPLRMTRVELKSQISNLVFEPRFIINWQT
jgi:hypothetical protein